MKDFNPVLFKRVGDLEVSPVTLLDAFAAASLAGIRADPEWQINREDDAKKCYQDAMAMLVERQVVLKSLERRANYDAVRAEQDKEDHDGE